MSDLLGMLWGSRVRMSVAGGWEDCTLMVFHICSRHTLHSLPALFQQSHYLCGVGVRELRGGATAPRWVAGPCADRLGTLPWTHTLYALNKGQLVQAGMGTVVSVTLGDGQCGSVPGRVHTSKARLRGEVTPEVHPARKWWS